MAYSLSTFLKPLSPTDTSVQIMDTNMIVKWTINPFTVKNTFVQGNLVKISLNSDREIVLDFRTTNESKQALVKLQSQLEVLRNKTPQYIDKIIEEYIQGIGLSYSNGNLYFSANLIPSINSTFSIGLSGSNWLDLYVGTSPQGFEGPQGPTGSFAGSRFINTSLPNQPNSLSPIDFDLALPWPYDSYRGISLNNGSTGYLISIDSSDVVRWYNVQFSFYIYNATNETYGYSLKYNTGSGTYSIIDVNINGANDANKIQSFSNILRVPIGITASLYFRRYTTQSVSENVTGYLNIIEII